MYVRAFTLTHLLTYTYLYSPTHTHLHTHKYMKARLIYILLYTCCYFSLLQRNLPYLALSCYFYLLTVFHKYRLHSNLMTFTSTSDLSTTQVHVLIIFIN